MNLEKLLDEIKDNAPLVYWIGLVAIVLAYQLFFRKKEETKNEKQ